MRARTTAKDGDKESRKEGIEGRRGDRIMCESLRVYPTVSKRVEQRKSEMES